MLPEQTYDLLRTLRWGPFAEALQRQHTDPAYQGLTCLEHVGLAAEHQRAHDQQRKLDRGVHQARFRVTAVPESLDHRTGRGLERGALAGIFEGGLFKRFGNVLITGKTGTGKTHTGCAIGHWAVRQGFTVRYFSLPKLLEMMVLARLDGSLLKLTTHLARMQVLVFDDWGMAPLTPQGAQDLFRLIDDRVGRGSLIVMSQLPVDLWHAFINDPMNADAILDRVVHNAVRLELHGDSMRRQPRTS